MAASTIKLKYALWGAFALSFHVFFEGINDSTYSILTAEKIKLTVKISIKLRQKFMKTFIRFGAYIHTKQLLVDTARW